MFRNISIILVIIFWGATWTTVQGQDAALDANYTPQIAGPDEKLLEEMKIKIQDYIADMNDLVVALSVLPYDSLYNLQRAYMMADAKWKTYYEAQQMDIATSDELLDLVAQYRLVSQSASEALERMKAMSDAQSDFLKAQQFITDKEEPYKKMYKEAMALQMVQKMASRLDRLKAQEQALFAEIESSYQQARNAVAVDPTLAKSMSQLEETYLDLKTTSTAIQAAAYKPLIQRIKDKLLIGAAIAIVLMFVAMVTARIEAFKKAREVARKMKSQLMNNQDYPTI